MKKLIKNGFIVDGSGNPGYKADVLLNGGIIEKIAETIEEDGAEIINAEASTEQWRSSVASCHVRQSYGIHVRADLTARARRLWK